MKNRYQKLKIGIVIPYILIGIFLPGLIRGEIPSAFVDIGYGARPMGMGGAYVALASDPHGVLWNPSCLPYARGWQVTTMYAKQFQLIPYFLASFTRGTNGNRGVGAAVLSSGDDVLRETTILASYGMQLGSGANGRTFSLGATAKYRMSSFGNNPDGGENQIQGSASGFGLDLGLRWKFAPKWALGVLARDIFNQVNWNNETRGMKYGESIPPALIIGAAFLAHDNVVFVLDYDKSISEGLKDKLAAGFEWRLFKIFFLRGGWSQNMDTETNRKFNWGLGLQYFGNRFGIRFDFAYQTHHLATTPRVSTSLWF